MKKENEVCEGHVPSFFRGDPEYKIVSEDKCYWCNHNKKIKKDKKQKTKKDPLLSSLSTIGLGVGLMTAMTGLLTGGLNKMFGTGDIPKGVVKELMEGVMDGLIFHFQGQIDDLKESNKKLVEANKELEQKVENLEEENKAFKDGIAEAVKKSRKKKK